MPGYKRNFKRRVLNVIRSDQETKRCIQTRQSYFANTSPDQFVEIGQNSSGDSAWNKYVWSIIHNTPKFFPVNLVGCTRGSLSGYSVGINHAGGTIQQTSVRVGSEIYCKGISFDFMVHLMKQIPHAKLHVSLIRYAKDDFPDKSKLYKGYTGITELDMRDTRRFKTLKSWNYYIRQVQPTTAGQEVDTTGTGVVGEDMNSDAYAGDKLKVLSDADGKTPSEWMTLIEQEYPDWRIVVDGDSSMGSSNFQQMLHMAGYDEEASTLFQRYSPNDLGSNTQGYKVISETSTMNNYSYVSKYLSNYWYADTNELYTTEIAQQVVLTPKVGMAAPSEGQILVPSNTKCSLWIPGKLLYPGGYIHYKESPATGDSGDVDAQYDHVLMFQTYLNYQTWDFTTVEGGASTVYPEILRLTDFLNVMYFKDP